MPRCGNMERHVPSGMITYSHAFPSIRPLPLSPLFLPADAVFDVAEVRQTNARAVDALTYAAKTNVRQATQ
jgi:hypothetical protein